MSGRQHGGADELRRRPGVRARAARGGVRTRMLRVEEQLRQELSTIMVGGMKDERVRLATVSAVRCTPDLRDARVMVSALGADAERGAVLEGLRHAEGFLRGELGHRLENLRSIPHLRFELDESIADSIRIHSVLRGLPEVVETEGDERGDSGEAADGVREERR